MLPSRSSKKTEKPTRPTPVSESEEKKLPNDGLRRIRRIGRSLHIQGALTAESDLSIDGKFDGKITIQDHCLSTSAASFIVADILAKEVVVRGRVKGNIVAGERVTITRTATVDGDVRAPRVTLEPGGTVNGTIVTESAVRSTLRLAEPE